MPQLQLTVTVADQELTDFQTATGLASTAAVITHLTGLLTEHIQRGIAAYDAQQVSDLTRALQSASSTVRRAVIATAQSTLQRGG